MGEWGRKGRKEGIEDEKKQFRENICTRNQTPS